MRVARTYKLSRTAFADDGIHYLIYKESPVTKCLLLAGLTAAVCLLLLPAPGYAQDVITKRNDLMESANEANRAIREAAKQKDYVTIDMMAQEIIDYMKNMAELFPKGSVSEKSLAHPDIWVKWDEFRKHERNVIEAAEGLRKAAAARDDAQIAKQVKAIGGLGSGACGGCHLSFNKKRMKKP
jgi:cytochrome c556